MNNVSTQALTSLSLTALKEAKRDVLSDWRRWSAVERSVAIAAAVAILAAPIFASVLVHAGS